MQKKYRVDIIFMAKNMWHIFDPDTEIKVCVQEKCL